jgi:lantibiotic modifying enzyme
MPSRGPLTGFSHGAAGIALSLLELARATGESRFHTQALAAIQYERSLFATAEGNWANLSLAGGGDPETLQKAPINFLVSWCHGAPGIGLARLRGLRHLDDPAARTEIDVALKTTLAQGFGHNHTLCHGDLGNLELLLEAGQTLNDSGWRSETRRLASSILDSVEREGWLCATPMAVETPGLMTGLAGIGYQLLRLAEPDRTPSVLALAPPV